MIKINPRIRAARCPLLLAHRVISLRCGTVAVIEDGWHRVAVDVMQRLSAPASPAIVPGFRLPSAEVAGFKGERHKPSYRSVPFYVYVRSIEPLIAIVLARGMRFAQPQGS